MDKISVIVKDIENIDTLHIVKFDLDGLVLTMMSLELPPKISVGKKVKLSIKPTHVAIAKNLSGELSYSNQLKVHVVSINQGRLLSSISLKIKDDVFLESIITKSSLERLNLKEGDSVTALIKASELSIAQVYDD